MNYSSVNMNKILEDLQKTRLQNMLLLQDRKKEIYEKIPKIKEIDMEIASGSLEAAKKRILNQNPDSTVSISEIKERNLTLSLKKKALLKENGYPDDYLNEIYNCPICRDEGYINNKPCSCLEGYIIEEMYRQSNLINILKQENFDTFSLKYYSREKSEGQNFSPYVNMSNILKRSKEFIKNFDTKFENILIWGESGLGKTFLTNCIAKELLDTGHTVLYLSSNELFEDILSKYIMSGKNSDELSTIYNFIYTCELLIIDDLGTELTNSFQLSQLFEIINKRSISKRSTLISTNLSMKQLSNRYTERIVSRLVADYMVFYVYGTNIRYQKRRALMNKTKDTN